VNDIVYISNKPASDCAGREVSFSLTIGAVVFKICHYFDLPGECHVISPPRASRLPQAGPLVDYLVSVLGFQQVFFDDELENAFREADFQSLTMPNEAEPQAADSEFLFHDELAATK
jgi:hypothetical protein